MGDFLIQATIGNFLLASLLALIASFVQHRLCAASLANLLWTLVLIKLISPPLVSFPVLAVPMISQVEDSENGTLSGFGRPKAPERQDGVEETSDFAARSSGVAAFPVPRFVNSFRQAIPIILSIWGSVSAALFFFSLRRIIRFHLLMHENAKPYQGLSQTVAAGIARKLGLRKPPEILETKANIAPLVWWKSGRAVIVVPSCAIEELKEGDLHLVLAHEMAHIKRRDHWFRWLEWFALIGLWWNPLMWWARKQSRISEEMACDDLVLELSAPGVQRYGTALLNMAELLTAVEIRPPAVASSIDSGGILEQRLKMMITDKTRKISASMRLAVVAVAAALFPLGVVYAQDIEAVEKRLGGAVEAGELSIEQAQKMLEVLRRARSATDMGPGNNRLERAKDEIRSAVKAGMVSAEEGEMKLLELRKKLEVVTAEGKRTEKDMAPRTLRLQAVTDEIKSAVKAGKLSAEEGEMKLLELRKKLEGVTAEGKRTEKDMAPRTLRLQAVTDEIKSAVKAGKLSAEEGEMKLLELRKKMNEGVSAGGKEKAEMTAQNKRLEAFAEDLEQAVKTGRLSEESAKEKLKEAREKIFGTERSTDNASSRDERRERLDSLVVEIREALKAGSMSKDEAIEKLIRAHKEQFRVDR